MTNPLTNYLEQIKLRLSEATPGPWYINKSNKKKFSENPSDFTDKVAFDIRKRSDAILISSAPSDLDRLIRIVEVLSYEIKIARDGLAAKGMGNAALEEALVKSEAIAAEDDK